MLFGLFLLHICSRSELTKALDLLGSAELAELDPDGSRPLEGMHGHTTIGDSADATQSARHALASAQWSSLQQELSFFLAKTL